MKILFLSSEIDPFAKTGGLADVAGSLPIALSEKGAEIFLAMPKYPSVGTRIEGKLGKKIPVYFIDHPRFFNRSGLYGENGKDYADNLERFAFYCKAVLSLLKEKGLRVDLIHCNDWQTALVPVYLKSLADDPFFRGVKSCFTIHNLGYQGLFPESEWDKTGLDRSYFHMEALEFYGKMNVLKGGLVFSDVLTTVSPTYSQEIQTKEFGHGLEGVLSKRRHVLFGILNGIDQSVWDPSKDKALPAPYGPDALDGKKENKKELQRSCGLPFREEIPLIGIVSRLADQKGFDLLVPILEKVLKMDFQIVLLGAGDKIYEERFQRISKTAPQEISVHLGFDPVLARKIYAGSDFFLMPSRYEPCGLGQMIALRYGTIPVVRRTGGLADTVTDVSEGRDGNGFVFSEYRSSALLATLERARKAYRDKTLWRNLIREAMRVDFSWDRSAGEYLALYRKVLSR